MTKTTKIILKILAVCVFAFFCYGYFPVRFAIKESNIVSSENKIFCRRERTTGFDWVMITEENGKIKAAEYIMIEGKSPLEKVGAEAMYGTNTFVFYGEFVGEGSFDEVEKYRIFICDKWDVLYSCASKRAGNCSRKHNAVYI